MSDVVVPDSGYYLKGKKYVIDFDPQDVMDYSLDHTAWLASSDADTIALCTVTADPKLTVSNVSFDTLTTTAWISGGATAEDGELLFVTFHITTANVPARQRDFTIWLKKIAR
jgi:hypothetical protein